MTTVNGEYFPDPSPKPHPRIKPEAASYADRNRGTMERWFDYSGNDGYESPKPVGRSVTDEGRKNAAQNQGSMSSIMGGYADPPAQRHIHPRAVKGEAAENASHNQGGAMKELIDNYGHLQVEEMPHHKVHGHDAEEYAERNQGTMGKIMGNYGQPSPEQPPQPKVYYGGQEVAEKYKGKDMGPILSMEKESPEEYPAEPKVSRLHQQSKGAGWDEAPPAVRTRPEAGEISEKLKEDVVGNLMRGEVAPPTVRETKLPPHMQTAETPRPQTSPVRMRPEGMTNYMKNHSSEMSAIMHGEATPSRNVKKQNRMMMRSEDW